MHNRNSQLWIVRCEISLRHFKLGDSRRTESTWPPLDTSVVSRTGQIINVIYSYSQFNITKNILEAQNIISFLPNKFDRNSRGDAKDAEKLKKELAVLERFIGEANQGIGLAISAGLEILRLQNKSVGDLFRQFNEPPPPGFD